MITFEKYIEDLVKKGKVSSADAKTFLGKESESSSSVASVKKSS
jgi:twitching motility protein PilT